MRKARRGTSALVALLALASAGAFAAADSTRGLRDYGDAAGETLTGLRPTGVGLPQIGAHGTIGAGDLADQLRSYHDSGGYGTDLKIVEAAARTYLQDRLDQNAAPAKRARRCKTAYRRAKVTGAKTTLYRQVRRCRTVVTTAPA